MRCLSLLLLLWAASTSALQFDAITTNDLHRDGEALRVNGSDPFIVFALNSRFANYVEGSHELQIGMLIERPSVGPGSIDAELFYQKAEDSSFSAQQRLQLAVPADSKSGFRIKLPEQIKLNSNSKLRLDLINCEACLLRPVKTDPSAGLATISRAYLGRREVPASGLHLTHVIDKVPGYANWSAHDIRLNGDRFSMEGGDPYLISPRIDAATDQLGGVLFDFKVTNAQQNIHDFQLFYATERHRFVESASSIFRILNSDQRLRFVIPLSFLHDEFPGVDILHQLRLDFTTHSVVRQAKAFGEWRLDEVRLLNKSQLAEYRELIPAQLVHTKFQRQNKRQLLSGIILKLTGDLLFLLSYLTLILGLIAWLMVRFKGASND